MLQNWSRITKNCEVFPKTLIFLGMTEQQKGVVASPELSKAYPESNYLN